MALLAIDEVIRTNAKAYGDRIAATMDGEVLTYAALDAEANRLCRALHDGGVGYGARLATWSDNALRLIPLYIATARLGAVFCPINARLSADEARGVMALAEPALLITDSAHDESGCDLASAAGVAHYSLVPSGTAADLFARARSCSSALYVEPRRCDTDTQVIFFTSGSTGQSKGVLLSHRVNYLRSAQGGFIDEPLRKICMFPLFHMGAFQLAAIAWQTLGEITFVRSADAKTLLDAVAARKANHIYCIPAVWNRILSEETSRWDLSSLRFIDTGTSATPPALITALKQRFPQGLVRVFYGSTEAGLVTGLFDRDVERKPGSAGAPAPGVELRISEAGEILIRSPVLMDGYFRNEAATAQGLAGGWYHSGDRGEVDGDGFLYVTGRLKDVIRTGGETVAPAEVETLLITHPAIADAGVFGAPDATWGELVCAAIVLKAGAPALTVQQIKDHFRDRIAPYKLPRRIELIDKVPRTAATLQTQRGLLLEWLLSRG